MDLSILRPFTLDEICRYIDFLRRNAASNVADAVEQALRREWETLARRPDEFPAAASALRFVYTAAKGRPMHDPVSIPYLLARAEQVRNRAASTVSEDVRKALLDLAGIFDARAAAAAIHCQRPDGAQKI